MVFVSAFLLLFAAPALLLWLGRLTERATHRLTHPAAPPSQESAGLPWFYRPARPLFVSVGPRADGRSEGAQSGVFQADSPWYCRPVQPVARFDLKRLLRRGGRADAKAQRQT